MQRVSSKLVAIMSDNMQLGALGGLVCLRSWVRRHVLRSCVFRSVDARMHQSKVSYVLAASHTGFNYALVCVVVACLAFVCHYRDTDMGGDRTKEVEATRKFAARSRARV